MARYLAAIHQAEGSAFGVSFPEVPGCISAGRTLDIALRNAAEALALHFEGIEEDGAEIPQPATGYHRDMLAEFIGNGTEAEESFVGFHWVTPKRSESDRAVRLNITLLQSLVDEIDTVAGERERSAFLATGARDLLDAIHRDRAAGLETFAAKDKKRGRRSGMLAGKKRA